MIEEDLEANNNIPQSLEIVTILDKVTIMESSIFIDSENIQNDDSP